MLLSTDGHSVLAHTVGRVKLELPHEDIAEHYASARRYPQLTHLDSAAAGRSSAPTIEAVRAHLTREAATGGYLAQAAAGEFVEAGRARLAGLLGHEELAFTESATSALTSLLLAMGLPRGAEAWVAPGEFGPNLAVFAAFGLAVETMPVQDEVGHLDAEGLRARLRRSRPALIHLCYHGSHRGIVQPARSIVELARE
jgi:pyridoxal 5-phosphate dependent beta-lyase